MEQFVLEEVKEKRAQINTTEYNTLRERLYMSLAKSLNADPAVECPKPSGQRGSEANQPLLLSHMRGGAVYRSKMTL